MRIGVNCYMLQPHIGGMKQYFLTLFRELLEHDAANEYVFFWYAQNEEELARLGTDRWKDNAILLADQREIVQHAKDMDLYFCPFSVLYPQPMPLPTVVTLHDIQEKYYPEFFAEQDLYSRDLYYESSTRMSDRVITVSEFSKESIVKHHGLPESKVTVAYHSVDKVYYRADRAARPPSQPLPKDYIYYPANLWKHKNHDRLLQALRMLRHERGLTIDLVLTGFQEPNGYPLETKAEEYGIRDQIHILGYVSVEEVAHLYSHARMLVFPSLFEGFGIPLVEAMAAGCPVVAANSTSIPEVVGEAAVLFDPETPHSIARAINRVWQDASLRQRMIDAGRQRAADFSSARTAHAHLAAFAQAVADFSYHRYLFNRWVYQYYYTARLTLRWRRYLATKGR